MTFRTEEKVIEYMVVLETNVSDVKPLILHVLFLRWVLMVVCLFGWLFVCLFGWLVGCVVVHYKLNAL